MSGESKHEFYEQLKITPPRCLAKLSVKVADLPVHFDNSPKSTWRLACGQCGEQAGFLLGHSFQKLDPTYVGRLIFVSPLAFKCSKCHTSAELLDTDLHGYHNELSLLEGDEPCGTKYRGDGEREEYLCSSCQNISFRLIVSFVYWPDAIEEILELFDELCSQAPLKEFFSLFLCYASCTTCDALSEPTDFGKL